jgi:hypothetical protein
MMPNRLRWLMWSWRVACASYVVGLLTMLPYASLIVWWTTLLFTPLLVVTLLMTRSRPIAMAGIPVVAAALGASMYLWYSISTGNPVPRSIPYLVIWFVGILGPVALYPLVSRYVATANRE